MPAASVLTLASVLSAAAVTANTAGVQRSATIDPSGGSIYFFPHFLPSSSCAPPLLVPSCRRLRPLIGGQSAAVPAGTFVGAGHGSATTVQTSDIARRLASSSSPALPSLVVLHAGHRPGVVVRRCLGAFAGTIARSVDRCVSLSQENRHDRLFPSAPWAAATSAATSALSSPCVGRCVGLFQRPRRRPLRRRPPRTVFPAGPRAGWNNGRMACGRSGAADEARGRTAAEHRQNF